MQSGQETSRMFKNLDCACIDCLVACGDGEMHDDMVFASSAKQHAEEARKWHDRWAEKPYANSELKKMLSKFSLFEHLDEEYLVFKFCPNCGKKIDWDELIPADAEKIATSTNPSETGLTSSPSHPAAT